MRLYKILLAPLLAVIALVGCQKEIDVTILPPPEDAFTANSPTTAIIARTSLHDGSYDNILDSASCFSVILPVTVTVNGQQITITKTEDIKLIERIWDESSADQDYVNLLFPVTVLRADHTTLTVANKDALHDLRDQCEEGGLDDDIECIDFLYPIKITAYDTQNQVTNVMTINDDNQLHDFMESLDDDELLTFAFPLVLIFTDGTELTLNDNKTLESVIEDAADDCDEDDDNDFDDDDVDDSNLVAVLVSGTWKVSSFIHENENETSEFTNFEFTFNANGTAIATKGALTVNGTWVSYGDDGVLEIDLYFGETEPLEDLGEDWDVKIFTTTTIHLVDEVNVANPERTLVFEKI
jgi:hypothetical protein